MNSIQRRCLSAVAAAAILAMVSTASQAQGYDLGGIRESHPDWFRPGSPTYNPDWAGPPRQRAYPYTYPYAYECPRQLVPVRLRSGRVVMRWMHVC